MEQIENLTRALQVNVGIEEVVLKGGPEEEVTAFASELLASQRLRKVDTGGKDAHQKQLSHCKMRWKRGSATSSL